MPRRRKYNRCTCGKLKSVTARRCSRCHARAYAAKQSAAKKGKPPRGYGWKHSAKTRAKMAAHWTEERRRVHGDRIRELAASDPDYRRRIGSPGPSNPMYRHGRSVTKYAPGFTKALKLRIRERDEFTCLLCGVTEDETGYVHSVHHVDYDKANHDPDNLATTCKNCNSRVNTNEDVWRPYFMVLAEARRETGKNFLHLIGRKVITQSKEGIVILHA